MKSATKEFGRLLRGALPFSVVNPNPKNLLENVLSYNSTDDAGAGVTLIKADGDISVGRDLKLDNGGMEIGPGGNVGIGVYPSTKLHVKSNGTGLADYGTLYLEVDTPTNFPAMVIQTSTGGNAADTHGLYIKNTAEGAGFRVDDDFYITSSGNIGINTDSPAAKLHIQGDNYSISNGGRAPNGLIFLGGTAGVGSYTNGLSFGYGLGSAAIAGVQTGADSDTMGMAFFTHPSGTGTDDVQESMRIQANGDVLIGDTSTSNPVPASNDGVFLYAAGGIEVINNTDNGSSSFYGTASSTDPNAALASGHSLNLYNLDSTDGNVGGHLRFGKADSLSTSYIGGVNVSHTNREGALIFGTSNGDAPTERMRITKDGNVGIGTDNPANELTLFGGVGTQPSADPFGEQNSLWICQGGTNNAGISLTIDNNGGTEATMLLQMNASNNSGIVGTYADNDLILRTNNTNRILIEKTTGNVGIGTDEATHKLTLNYGLNGSSEGMKLTSATRTTDENGLSAIEVIGNTSYGTIFNLQMDGQIQINPLGTEAARITSTGNVGINQNNPQYKLDVNGTVNVEGQFRTAMTIASPMLVEVTAGTYWSLGWWQAADNSWWLLGKMSEETSGFTRAQAEFYVPLGMIADVPSA